MKRLRVGGKVLAEVDDSGELIVPQAGGQYSAFTAMEDEVLCGGSAGGGKSWFLVVDALGLQFTTALGKAAYEHAGYRAVLFRRESTQLDRLISEAKLIYPLFGGVYVGGRQGEPGPCFEFPDYGSKVFFCHLQNENDKENHQGQEYQYVGFDELTHFTITQYLYLFSRLRSTIPKLPCRMRSTTNPTGEGLWWVRKRFIDNWTPNTRRYFMPPDDPERDPRGRAVEAGTKNAMSRRFIPFWLQENKKLWDNDPQYAVRIMALGGQMEKALLGGDWYAFGGDMFPGFDRHTELIQPFYIPDKWGLIGSIDPGFSSPCSFGLHASDFKDNYYRIATYYQDQTAPDRHAANILKFIKENKWTQGRMPTRIVSGHDAFAKLDRYSVIESDKTFADAFMGQGLFLEKAYTDRLNGWWNWKALMPKRWFVFEPGNGALLDEMSAAVSDEKVPEDLKGRGNDPDVKDHALDECRYGLMAIVKAIEQKPESKGWEDTLLRGKKRFESESVWSPGRG